MTWRWAICFNLAALCCGATVSGRVDVSGSKDLSGVVVWLESASGIAPPTPSRTATVAQTHKSFMPHVTAVRTGSKVQFPNLDPFFHNAFSKYDGQKFDLGLPPPGYAVGVTFSRPGVVHVFCNIHPTMSAVIVVLDTPWFAVTDELGAFHIAAVTPGEYRLRVFHERVASAELQKIERNVIVGTDDVTVSGLQLPEARYITPPHKNKFGEDYPPIIVDQYPGSRK